MTPGEIALVLHDELRRFAVVGGVMTITSEGSTHRIVADASRAPGGRAAVGAILMLMGSAACVAIAPALIDDSYSVLEQSISESGGQGVEGAWLARVGFLLLGFGVLVIAGLARNRWGLWGALAHRIYGVSMIATAAFAHMPWRPDVPYVAFEDFLHSVAANIVGASFTIGVLIVSFTRSRDARVARAFDWLAIVAAIGISIMIFNVAGVAGLVQRIMFVIGYLWYGAEAVRSINGLGSESPVRDGAHV